MSLLSGASKLPQGFRYRPELLARDEESALLEIIERLPFRHAQYKQYTARRRIVSFGGSCDFSSNELRPAGPIAPFLLPLRDRLAEWTGLPSEAYSHATIAEYAAGTQLGWHRDVPDFQEIAGVSLGGRCRIRLRPYPPRKGRRDRTVSLDLEPRSAYAIVGEARWGWQHAISPTRELRYSITFRTLRAA